MLKSKKIYLFFLILRYLVKKIFVSSNNVSAKQDYIFWDKNKLNLGNSYIQVLLIVRGRPKNENFILDDVLYVKKLNSLEYFLENYH